MQNRKLVNFNHVGYGTPLICAIKCNNIAVSNILFEYGAEINLSDEALDIPLIVAVRHKNLELVKLLLKEGANPNLAESWGDTALGEAVSALVFDKNMVTLQIVAELLKSGAIFDLGDRKIAALNETNEHVYLNKISSEILSINHHELQNDIEQADLFDLVSDDNNLEIVRKIIASGEDVNQTRPGTEDILAYSLLENAALYDAILVANLLLENGATHSLISAIYMDDKKAVKKLLLENHLNRKIAKGNSLLHKAVYLNLPCVVDRFLEYGIAINIMDNNGMTPLRVAMFWQRIEIVDLLLKRGADFTSQDRLGFTPLDRAVYYQDLEIVKRLVIHGADVNTRSSYNSTPLHTSCDYIENPSIVEYLIKNGADINVKNNEGYYPSSLAISASMRKPQKAWAITDMLLKNGAKFNFIDALWISNNKIAKQTLKETDLKNMPEVDLARILYVAAGTGNIGIIHELINSGIKLNLINFRQKTAIDIANIHGHYIVEEFLRMHGALYISEIGFITKSIKHNWGFTLPAEILEAGEDINSQNNSGETPLHNAIKESYYNIAKKLIDYGVDVNLKTSTGDTPLHSAITSKIKTVGTAIIKLLLERPDINLDITNKDNHTPLMLAKSLNRVDIADLLAQHKLLKRNKFISSQEIYHNIIHDIFATDPTVSGNCQTIINETNKAWFAVKNNDIRALKNCDMSLINKENLTYYLQYACEHNYYHIVERLIKPRKLKTSLKTDSNDNCSTSIKIDINYAGIQIFSRLAPLIYAVKNNSYKSARILLENGADTNIKDDREYSPLHIASFDGHTGILRLLLRYKHDINVCNKQGNTLLHLALYSKNSTKIIDLLLENRANIYARNSDGKTPYIYALTILKNLPQYKSHKIKHEIEIGCKQGRELLHEKLFGNAVDDVNKLFNAIHYNKLDVVQELIARDKSLIRSIIHCTYLKQEDHFILDKRVSINNTNMEYPSNQQNTTITSILPLTVKNDYDQKIRITSYNPLHYACRCGNIQIVNYLIENGADINYRYNITDRTALFDAALHQQNDVVEFLLSKGVNIKEVDEKGHNMLHYAISFSNIKLCELLIKNGLDPNKVSYEGDSSISIMPLVTDNNSIAIADLLLKNGANINHQNKDSETVLHFIAKHAKPYLPLLKFLLESGANPNIRCKNKRNAFHEAACLGITEVVEALIPKMDDINIQDIDGMNALHYAVTANNINIVKILIKNNADLNLANKELYTATYFAVYNNNLEMLKLLAENGANLYLKNYIGSSLMHIAAAVGSFKIVSYLINQGLNINSYDNNKFTSLDFATYNEQTEITNWLKTQGAVSGSYTYSRNILNNDEAEQSITKIRNISIFLSNHKRSIDYPVDYK